jgi:hypothetical protein
VAADGNIGANGDPPAGEAAPTAALVSELTEALTALGNYLASANKLVISSPSPEPQRLGEAIRKSLCQHERAVEATRGLRALNRCRKTVREDGLIGLR